MKIVFTRTVQDRLVKREMSNEEKESGGSEGKLLSEGNNEEERENKGEDKVRVIGGGRDMKSSFGSRDRHPLGRFVGTNIGGKAVVTPDRKKGTASLIGPGPSFSPVRRPSNAVPLSPETPRYGMQGYEHRYYGYPGAAQAHYAHSPSRPTYPPYPPHAAPWTPSAAPQYSPVPPPPHRSGGFLPSPNSSFGPVQHQPSPPAPPAPPACPELLQPSLSCQSDSWKTLSAAPSFDAQQHLLDPPRSKSPLSPTANTDIISALPSWDLDSDDESLGDCSDNKPASPASLLNFSFSQDHDVFTSDQHQHHHQDKPASPKPKPKPLPLLSPRAVRAQTLPTPPPPPHYPQYHLPHLASPHRQQHPFPDHPALYPHPPPPPTIPLPPPPQRSTAHDLNTVAAFCAPPPILPNKKKTTTSFVRAAATKSSSTKWNKEDDEKLVTLMKRRRNVKDWAAIAREHCRGKTGKECHERWIHYLKPGVRKGHWKDYEDAVVFQAVTSSSERPFTKWSDLARKLPGRAGKQIRDRWVNYLNPALRHLPFTREDDLLLYKGHVELGKRWAEISVRYFHSVRSENQIKNRWYSASFRKFVVKEYGAEAYYGKKGGPDGDASAPNSPSHKKQKIQSSQEKHKQDTSLSCSKGDQVTTNQAS